MRCFVVVSVNKRGGCSVSALSMVGPPPREDGNRQWYGGSKKKIMGGLIPHSKISKYQKLNLHSKIFSKNVLTF